MYLVEQAVPLCYYTTSGQVFSEGAILEDSLLV